MRKTYALRKVDENCPADVANGVGAERCTKGFDVEIGEGVRHVNVEFVTHFRFDNHARNWIITHEAEVVDKLDVVGDEFAEFFRICIGDVDVLQFGDGVHAVENDIPECFEDVLAQMVEGRVSRRHGNTRDRAW